MRSCRFICRIFFANCAVSPDLRLEAPDPNPNVSNRKWVGTSMFPGVATIPGSDGKRYASFSIENSGDSRFIPNKTNPGGKESFSFTLVGFKSEPAVYSGDGELLTWFYTYKSDHSKFQADHSLMPLDVNFTVTAISKVREDAGRPVYSMSGTFDINYYREPFNTSGTPLQHVSGAFNKLEIMFNQ